MAGLAAALAAHRLVGLDTSVFICHFEGRSPYVEGTELVFAELAQGSFSAVTSVLTLMELAVRPLQLQRPDAADEYELLVWSLPNLVLVDLDRDTARKAAELRASYRLRPADALQVAACLRAGATAFLTNDRDLLRVRDLQVLLLEDFIPGPGPAPASRSAR